MSMRLILTCVCKILYSSFQSKHLSENQKQAFPGSQTKVLGAERHAHNHNTRYTGIYQSSRPK